MDQRSNDSVVSPGYKNTKQKNSPTISMDFSNFRPCCYIQNSKSLLPIKAIVSALNY